MSCRNSLFVVLVNIVYLHGVQVPQFFAAVSNQFNNSFEAPKHSDCAPDCAQIPTNATCNIHPQLTWNSSKWDGKVMQIHFGEGRFGNQLFYVAATLAHVVNRDRPLIVFKSRVGWGLTQLPCLESSPGLEVALANTSCKEWSVRELLKHNGIESTGCYDKLKENNLIEEATEGGFQQDLALWGSNRENLLPILRQVLHVSPDVAGLPELPGQEDIVLYFRSFNVVNGNATNATNVFHNSTRLASPPFKFYKRAVGNHRSVYKNGRVWVITSPDQRPHPTVLRLIRELNGTMYTEGDNAEKPWLSDFVWLSSARHIAISPSTYVWWAAFLGNATEIYFPIMPGIVPFERPWCRLMPARDTRYVFDDWWADKTYYSKKATESLLARHSCDAYLNNSVVESQLNNIMAFFPELK